jgi:hypothetical protein
MRRVYLEEMKIGETYLRKEWGSYEMDGMVYKGVIEMSGTMCYKLEGKYNNFFFTLDSDIYRAFYINKKFKFGD